MPTDGNFGFSVLIAGLPVPEYTKDGHTYVESNLWTPVSYQQSVREFAYGEVEEQSWPVTPYTIRVFTEPHCTLSWFDFYVDGVKVDWRVIGGSSEWYAKKVFSFAVEQKPKIVYLGKLYNKPHQGLWSNYGVVFCSFLQRGHQVSCNDTEFSNVDKNKGLSSHKPLVKVCLTLTF